MITDPILPMMKVAKGGKCLIKSNHTRTTINFLGYINKANFLESVKSILLKYNKLFQCILGAEQRSKPK